MVLLRVPVLQSRAREVDEKGSVGEQRGPDSFGFVRNSPLQHIDKFGLAWECTTYSYPVGPVMKDCKNYGLPYTWWRLDAVQFEGGEGPPSCFCHCEEVILQDERCIETQEWETRVECVDECYQDSPLVFTCRWTKNLGSELKTKFLGWTGNRKTFPPPYGCQVSEGICELCCMSMCSQLN